MSNSTTTTPRRALLAGAPAVAAAALAGGTVTNALAIAEAKAAAPDPVFGLIEEHKAACAAYDAISAVYYRMKPSAPGYQEARVADGEGLAWTADALADLLSCQPTTLQGVVALLEHLGQPDLLFYDERTDDGTVLSGAYEGDMDEVKDFPLRLAETLRSLTEGAQS